VFRVMFRFVFKELLPMKFVFKGCEFFFKVFERVRMCIWGKVKAHIECF